MIRISAGYSKKVPGEEEYSSNGYHITIEAEVPDILMSRPEELKSRITGIFEEAKQNVEAQVNGSLRESLREESASDKQKSFIVSLARRRHGMSVEDLKNWNGGVDVNNLSKKDASGLITRLKGGAL